MQFCQLQTEVSKTLLDAAFGICCFRAFTIILILFKLWNFIEFLIAECVDALGVVPLNTIA